MTSNPSTPKETPTHVLGLTLDQLTELTVAWGHKPCHARTVFGFFHRYGGRIPNGFPPSQLPGGYWDRLTQGPMPFDPIARVQSEASEDGASKYAFTLENGATVEGIFMPFDGRNTMCISSQVGCAMGCTFCATGEMGFLRNLSSAEIVSQVLHMRRRHPDEKGLTLRSNIVFMGMGEPLHNLDNVMGAVDLLTDPNGLNLTPRDIGISTSGLVPKIEALARYRNRPHLLVSIGATTDAERSRTMPINRAYPLEVLLRCLERYPLRKRERIVLSYVLIANQNDHDDDAKRLAAMSSRFPSMINLIPMNAHAGSPGMHEPSETRLQAFYQKLIDFGAFATVRRSRGRDVAGACGQLARSISGRGRHARACLS